MRPGDLLREALRALRGSLSRTVLTALGIVVGTMALSLILSLSLGLARVIDDLVASDDQLRQIIVMPGFGRQASDGRSTPTVEGEMSDLKRQRLQRTLLKRSRGGPPFQIRSRVIDAQTEKDLAALPGVKDTQAFLQDRYEVTLVGDPAPKPEPLVALSVGAAASHPYYPGRVLSGRWFGRDDERGVVVHEILLWKMGLTTDAQQAGVVGRKLKLTCRRAAGGLAAFFGGGAPAGTAPVLYEEEVPVVGVIRERFGDERATFLDEAFAMQADLFVPQAFARELWDRQPGRGGPQAVVLTAASMDAVGPIEDALRDRGLEVRSVRQAVEGIRRSLSVTTIIASALAGIALFVSALGIVNTLVMSVMERTREIGLLKALGATSGDVARIFLVEAGVLGFAGGVLGTSGGYLLSLAGNHFGRKAIEEAMLMPFKGDLFRFPWWLALGALAFAVGVSLAAAIVPTLRAARVDPVRALRHE